MRDVTEWEVSSVTVAFVHWFCCHYFVAAELPLTGQVGCLKQRSKKRTRGRNSSTIEDDDKNLHQQHSDGDGRWSTVVHKCFSGVESTTRPGWDGGDRRKEINTSSSLVVRCRSSYYCMCVCVCVWPAPQSTHDWRHLVARSRGVGRRPTLTQSAPPNAAHQDDVGKAYRAVVSASWSAGAARSYVLWRCNCYAATF